MHTLINDTDRLIDQLVAKEEARLIEIRRDIHAHPEIGFDVERTAGVVARELTRLGIEHKTGIGRTGVLGIIKGGRPGPTLLLRADMDALPIIEETELPYASTVKGRMHACGHDIHTSTLIGVAAVLKEIAPRLAGTVKLMFQPAEETPDSGAKAMIEDGILDGVDMALGFHNHPDEPTGMFSYIEGNANGSCDEFEITVYGRSGHAAHPDQAVDPIVASAHLVLALQTIVSRETNPMHPAVLTIGAIHAGDAYNVIPEMCKLIGTVRCQDPATRRAIDEAIHRQCRALEDMLRVKSNVNYMRNLPSLHHDNTIVSVTMAAIADHFGQDAVMKRAPSLGAEDFSLVGEMVPAFQLGIGSQIPGRNDFLHNGDYQPDETCIGLGVTALSCATVRLLEEVGQK
ncbi:M20 metallopeptidase family protein [Brucella pseudogrignonensis]|uniref:M20 metallopeptidase family protein n=1 Tax=Brucella pseudogrignonensis TaxID=419475 RepID=UPI003ECF826C